MSSPIWKTCDHCNHSLELHKPHKLSILGKHKPSPVMEDTYVCVPCLEESVACLWEAEDA